MKHILRSEILAAAQGAISCDWILKNARVLDVFSCSWLQRDIAIHQGVIVGIESDLRVKAVRTLDLKGKYIVPGFIDAHVHIESSLLTPFYFQSAVLPKGTTTAVCDPHELANVMGISGIRYFLESSEELSLRLKVMLSSCVPATSFETNGGGHLKSADLLPLKKYANALGLAEVMNVPGVLHHDADLMGKLDSFKGSPIDGHAPLLRGEQLSAYAAMGITSCHESSELEEAREKLEKGISVWIREGSVAKDLSTLAPLLNIQTSTSIGFCTDDRNPLDIHHEGHLDYLIRKSIQHGVTPEVAYRSASWTVARHYGLDRVSKDAFGRVGAIAPGYVADLVVLDDAVSCAIHAVFRAGALVSEMDFSGRAPMQLPPSIVAHIPEAADLEGPQGQVHVIGVIPGKIVTDNRILNSAAHGVVKFSVVERYGNYSKPANAYACGFGENFRGAIASSVGHDSHNLAVVGSQAEDMRTALASLIESQGGFCVVQDGKVLAHLALPLGGLMSNESPEKITAALLKLRQASRAIGCELDEPFLQLAFLCLPVIPRLKLTDKGLFDVEQFKLIPVAV